MTEKPQMRYVNKPFAISDTRKEELFDRTGSLVGEENKHKVPHYAKTISNTEAGGAMVYYVLTHTGTLLDPMGPYSKRQRNLDTKMKRVSKNTFDLYLTYLKTNNSIYLTKAQRGFLND